MPRRINKRRNNINRFKRRKFRRGDKRRVRRNVMFNNKTVGFAGDRTTINIEVNLNITELDGLAWQSVDTLIRTNEYINYSNNYQLVRLHKFVTIAMYPNDALNNKPTYMYCDWANYNGDLNYDIRAAEGHKEVFNDAKGIVRRSFKVWYLNTINNPRLVQKCGAVTWPGIVYFYQEGGSDLRAKIIFRCTFMKKRGPSLNLKEFIKEKKEIRAQYRERILDEVKSIKSSLSSSSISQSKTELDDEAIEEQLMEMNCFKTAFPDGFNLSQDFMEDLERLVRQLKTKDEIKQWIKVVRVIKRARMDNAELQVFKKIKNVIYSMNRQLLYADAVDVEGKYMTEKEQALQQARIDNREIKRELIAEQKQKEFLKEEKEKMKHRMKIAEVGIQKELIEKKIEFEKMRDQYLQEVGKKKKTVSNLDNQRQMLEGKIQREKQKLEDIRNRNDANWNKLQKKMMLEKAINHHMQLNSKIIEDHVNREFGAKNELDSQANYMPLDKYQYAEKAKRYYVDAVDNMRSQDWKKDALMKKVNDKNVTPSQFKENLRELEFIPFITKGYEENVEYYYGRQEAEDEKESYNKAMKIIEDCVE